MSLLSAGTPLAPQMMRMSLRAFSSREKVAEVKTVMNKAGKIVRRSKAGDWESVIGLEVHAQVNAASKMFSTAPTAYNSPVNSNVSYFDASIPGTLPVLNRRCVEAGVLTSVALGASLNHVSYFDRKHYFYADLPAGYQITQQRRPLAVGGVFPFPVEARDMGQANNTWYTRETGIVQLQLEQDSGKSLHDPEGGRSLIDLNRCGCGLMEIVFEPDLRHGNEAAALVKELRQILVAVASCKGRMEQGELRVDANVSVRRPGGELGVRTEVKNLNSIRSVALAVEYEVRRQIALLECGGEVENETRSFDVFSRRTVMMRDKEAKQDYRFMPEPNLPPLRLYDSAVEQPASPYMLDIAPLRSSIPELPAQTRAGLEQEHGLSPSIAARLVAWPELLAFFRRCVEKRPESTKEVADLVLTLVAEHCHTTGQAVGEIPLQPEDLVEISNMRQGREVSFTGLKEVMGVLLRGEAKGARTIVDSKKLYLVRDKAVILEFVKDIIAANPKLVEKVSKAGSEKKRLKAVQALVQQANMDPRVEMLDMAKFMQVLQSSLKEDCIC